MSERLAANESLSTGNIQPIKPEDVVSEKLRIFPDAVIQSFNELIAQDIASGSARVLQEKVVERIQEKDPSLKEEDMIDNGWLNVEEIYRQAGWDVKYDSPAYDESFEPFFTFKPSNKK